METNDPLGSPPPISNPDESDRRLQTSQSTSPLAEKDWNLAPGPVKFARVLTVLASIVYIYIFGVGIWNMGGPLGIVAPTYYCVMSGFFLLVNLWLYNALRWGEPQAYGLQRFIAILGLCLCPVGTILYGILLVQWSQSSVKSWFNPG